MARCRSRIASILVVDAFLVVAFYLSGPAFVPSPAAPRAQADFLGLGAAAVSVAAAFPEGAQAVEQWVYKEPKGRLEPTQIGVIWLAVFVHLAGIADTYAKSTGVGGPAVPLNPTRDVSDEYYANAYENFEKGFGGNVYKSDQYTKK
jgi:hypothetical protein